MIKLTEIVKNNEQLLRMKKAGLVAKKAASKMLAAKGMVDPDYFILRIKPFDAIKDPNWIALYRTHSVLSGRPIFWMNANLEQIAKEDGPDVNVIAVLIDNILHEYWHAITDLFRAMKFRKDVNITTKVAIRPDDHEEDEAEDFMRWCKGTPSGYDAYFEKAIQ
jgi:hypothetical protein